MLYSKQNKNKRGDEFVRRLLKLLENVHLTRKKSTN